MVDWKSKYLEMKLKYINLKGGVKKYKRTGADPLEYDSVIKVNPNRKKKYNPYRKFSTGTSVLPTRKNKGFLDRVNENKSIKPEIASDAYKKEYDKAKKIAKSNKIKNRHENRMRNPNVILNEGEKCIQSPPYNVAKCDEMLGLDCNCITFDGCKCRKKSLNLPYYM
tara:strand:- start:273 stop:773 length:501 start_codon:yes stop_codon:yes gene_type:complete